MPSASTVTRATMSDPGSKFGSSSPFRPRPLSPVRIPRAVPWSTSSCCAEVSVRSIAPPSSARSASQRPSSETERIMFPWFRIVGGGGILIADPLVSRYTPSPGTSP